MIHASGEEYDTRFAPLAGPQLSSAVRGHVGFRLDQMRLAATDCTKNRGLNVGGLAVAIAWPHGLSAPLRALWTATPVKECGGHVEEDRRGRLFRANVAQGFECATPGARDARSHRENHLTMRRNDLYSNELRRDYGLCLAAAQVDDWLAGRVLDR